MQVARIANATRILGAPKDWDESKQGACVGLPILDAVTSAGPGMISAWRPTPEEIERLTAGAAVYLTVLGHSHPPVAMDVGTPPDNTDARQLQLPISNRNSA